MIGNARILEDNCGFAASKSLLFYTEAVDRTGRLRTLK